MTILTIYEKDLTGGTCGFPANIPGMPSAEQIRNELIKRNRVIKQIEKSFDIKVNRIIIKNISQIQDTKVKELLFKEGNKAFPIFILKNKIIHFGSFPEFEVIYNILKSIKTSN